jgi:hypothetical protein
MAIFVLATKKLLNSGQQKLCRESKMLRSRLIHVFVYLVNIAWLSLDCSPSSPTYHLEVTAPQLLNSSLPTDGRPISTTDIIQLQFNQPMDPPSINSSSIAVVPFELLQSCTLDFTCAPNRCYHGSCQRDQISEAFLSDFIHPPLKSAYQKLLAPLSFTLSQNGMVLSIGFLEALAPNRFHTFLVSPILADREGNLIQKSLSDSGVFKQSFATSGAEGARPVLNLLSPADGSSDLPINLHRVVVTFTKPVVGVQTDALRLQTTSGTNITTQIITASPLCLQHPAGTCYEIRLLERMPPLQIIEVKASDAIHDNLGQKVLPTNPRLFATGEQEDTSIPHPKIRSLQIADNCLVLHLFTDEPTDLLFIPNWDGVVAASIASTEHEAGLKKPHQNQASLKINVTDLAGNQAPSIDQTLEIIDLPQVTISEVLANPAGPEPAQEFVEIINLSSRIVNLSSWSLDINQDGLGLKTLPPLELKPSQYGIIVGSHYNSASALDPPIDQAALLIQLEEKAGQLNLPNRGVPLALRDNEGNIVSTYSGYYDTSNKKSNGQSVERISLSGCDVFNNWRPNPLATSTPGLPPKN